MRSITCGLLLTLWHGLPACLILGQKSRGLRTDRDAIWSVYFTGEHFTEGPDPSHKKGHVGGGGYACACSDCPAVSILNLNLGCSSDAASGYQSIATCWSSAMVRVRLKLALGPGQMSWGQSFCSRYVYAVGGHNVSYEHARERDDIVRQDTCGDRRLAQLRQHLVNSPLHHLTTSATKHHHHQQQQQQRHH